MHIFVKLSSLEQLYYLCYNNFRILLFCLNEEIIYG